MEFDCPYTPFEAIKKTESYFTNEILNTTIKEKSPSKKDQQFLEIGVTGGNWEVFWMKISAVANNSGGSSVITKGRSGIMQLSFAAIIAVLSGPFFYLILWNEIYWAVIFPSFFLLLGLMSIIMPYVRIHQTTKGLKEVLTNEREIKKQTKIPQ